MSMVIACGLELWATWVTSGDDGIEMGLLGLSPGAGFGLAIGLAGDV
jgi:hypothetical protein